MMGVRIMSKALKICAFAQAQVDNGSIYVLGGQGETLNQITDSWIAKREHNNKKNIERVKKLLAKRINQGYKNLRAYDCSGLIIRHLLDEKLESKDKNANGIYNEYCIPIEKSELRAGDLVAKYGLSDGKYKVYHIGVYVGDGYVVHAKGRDVGVVREKISKYSWNRFGRLKAFIADGNNVISRLLKKGKKGEDVRMVQQALINLGYDLGKWGADGIFGSKTRKAVRKFQKDHGLKVDGIVGKQTATALGLVWKG